MNRTTAHEQDRSELESEIDEIMVQIESLSTQKEIIEQRIRRRFLKLKQLRKAQLNLDSPPRPNQGYRNASSQTVPLVLKDWLGVAHPVPIAFPTHAELDEGQSSANIVRLTQDEDTMPKTSQLDSGREPPNDPPKNSPRCAPVIPPSSLAPQSNSISRMRSQSLSTIENANNFSPPATQMKASFIVSSPRQEPQSPFYGSTFTATPRNSDSKCPTPVPEKGFGRLPSVRKGFPFFSRNTDTIHNASRSTSIGGGNESTSYTPSSSSLFRTRKSSTRDQPGLDRPARI